MLIATLMVETVVPTSTWITALNANVTFMKIVLLGIFRMWLVTASAMMRQTILTANLMVETAVDLMSIMTSVQIAPVKVCIPTCARVLFKVSGAPEPGLNDIYFSLQFFFLEFLYSYIFFFNY